MKIVQINAVYQTGSTGRIAMELHRALMDLGQESYVFTSDGNCIDANVFPLGSKLDHKAHALFSRLSGEQGYFSAGATKALLRELDRLVPDVVHLHNLHGNYIHLPMLLNYLGGKNIATVITLHDCWFFTGKCTHYTIQGCQRWQTGCYGCPRIKNDNASWFFDRTPKMWSDKKKLFTAIPRLGVIGVSDWITNEAKKSFLQHAAVIRRIYNWIDIDRFYPQNTDIRQKYQIPDEKLLILCIGGGWNEHSSKYQDLIGLSRLLPENMHILLAGAVNSSSPLPSNITSVGYVHGLEELAQVYSAADVYIHLSKEDTFGKVIAEAMACGTPAIVYDSTACPEIVGQNCGYIVPVGDLSQIYHFVCEIGEKGKSFYSASCRDFVEKRFKKEELIADTVGLYQTLIEMK
ncbi:glycosyltransferase [Flavonifractor sp. An100]|uniref:glycosyltransferase n=1 Tax=Flavonifractor sp. An100 TaxID=1965538 RepID=UPI000B390AC8|nr:glycosyltransferase [Flavonifractor sp. An100]OUQ79824.1 hypothetical protein B5E43_05320 [Flavonifractor sp. An100]